MRTTTIAKIITILSLLLIISGVYFVAQAKNTSKTITGMVTDDSDGSSIPGVTVCVKGTSNATVTNVNGKYSITVSSDESVLVFSCIGYQSVEKKVGKQNVLNVKLQPEVLMEYKDVIITGAYMSADLQEVSNRVKCAEPAMGYMVASPQYEPNSEEYGTFTENKFQLAKDIPLSTFSIDVDAASYANFRRFINQGQIPPRDAIRTEEMINYFDYNYPQPTGKQPINVITEVSDCPWNSQNRLLHIGIKAKNIPVEKLPESNLVFLIDVSGSMSGANRLPLVKSSMKLLVKQLRDKDKVAIVVYAGNAGVVLESTSGKEKEKIIAAIDKLEAGGSTAGGAGIQLAYKIAKDNFIKDGNNRVILATDGDFNVGVSSNDELEKLIENQRKSGVFLTVLGYGMGNYKDSKMQTLAQKGNGNHAYIDNLTEAKKVLVSEFSGTLFTIAKDVKLQLEFNPAKVQAYRLIGYESRLLNKEDFNDDTKDAGEMGAGHTVTALYEIVPVGVKSSVIGSVDELKYQKEKKDEASVSNTSNELLTVKIRYKAPDGDTSERIEVPVIDGKTLFIATSNNFRFSAAVAQVGMLLHDSPYKTDATYEKAIALAKTAYGDDTEGYRHEFVKLVENLQLMVDSNK